MLCLLHSNVGLVMLLVYHPGSSERYQDLPSDTVQVFEHNRPQQVLSCVRDRLKEKFDERLYSPKDLVSFEDLCLVHDANYVRRALSKSKLVGRMYESPLWSAEPYERVYESIVKPVLWKVSATSFGFDLALRHKESVACLDGGLHHAKKFIGGGFCLFSDIGVAIEKARKSNLLSSDDEVLYLDTDAHLGNGVLDIYRDDSRVRLLDIYNSRVYPASRPKESKRIKYLDCSLPCTGTESDEDYLLKLEAGLDRFLQSGRGSRAAVYNAGSDVYDEDRLGGMSLSYQGVVERNRLVLEALNSYGIPVLMLPSGGYSEASSRIYAETIVSGSVLG